MNKVLLTIIIFFGLNSILLAQNYNLQNGSFTVDCNTGGVLFDSGGPGGNYGNNENITMTICPDNPGFGVFATMIQVDIIEPDQLCIYDGDDNSAPLLPGNFAGDCLANNTDLENGAVFQATVGNATGCLTFEFSSDATETGSFQFNLACEARCQTVFSEISASIPDTVIEEGLTYINICLGDTLSVSSEVSFPQNNTEYAQSEATSTFTWDWGDDSPEGTSQNDAHFYDTPGGYIARLSILDVNGCRNFQDQIFRVRVAPIPEFIELDDSILCVGESDTISALPLGTIVNGQVVQGDTVYFVPPVFSGDSLSLPDGSGVGYDSDVFITSFDNNSEIINCGDILEVCVNMEHSFLGDLEITLTCPSGQSAILKAYPGGGGTYLGNPWDGADNGNGFGEGLSYCFNSNATTLLVDGPTQPATLTNGNTIVPGDYLPVDPFSNFIGCPINGQWTLNITDNLFIDDGAIFNWELNIHPCMYPEVDSFLMLYDFGFWEDDPSIVGIVSDSNNIIVQPDTIGPWVYNYFTEDQFGCEYSNTYQIFADGLEVEATPSDTSVCNEQEIQLNVSASGNIQACDVNYSVNPVASGTNMISGTGTNVSLGDDQMSGNITIPFPFDFYGNTYTQFRISSNGYITFDLVAGGSGCCAGQNLPNTANPNNLIALFWSDLNPNNGGTISYFVSGTAPNRIFVVEFNNVPHFGSGATVTGQIQLYESSNQVEIHCQDCQTDNGTITIGLENEDGTEGNPSPGHNATSASSTNTAWTFSPAGDLSCFDITWSPATGLSATNIPNPIATVSSDQQYIVEVINLNGCPAYDTVNIEVGGNFDYTITPDTTICNGDSLQLLITGGGETFAWSPNDGTLSDTSIANPLAFPLSTTTYNVAIDSAGCTANETVTITVSGVEVTNTIVTNESCAGAADGAIEILPAGEQYSIDGGVTFVGDNIFSGLAAGNYDIVVGGSANCDTSYTVSIIGGDPLLIDSIFTQDASCGSINDGIIEMYLSGGVAPLVYSIDSGATSQVSNIFNNLAGGDYNVLITDDLGCIADSLITLSQPDSLDISIVNIQDLSCFGDTTGTAEFSTSGGTPNFEYSLDNVTFSTTNTFSNLASGTFTVYVQDDNACLDSLDFTIEEPDSLFISDYTISNISCFGENDGSINIEGIGGTLPYNYSIDGGITFQPLEDFTNLSAGNRQLVIEDDNGCLSNQVLDSIVEPAELIVNILSSTDVLCNGASTGSIETDIAGGTLPYTFSWNSGEATQNISDIPAGNYEITVTDDNGCVALADTIVTEPSALELTLTPVNISCPNGDDGSVESAVLGGTPPYDYAWSNGQTSEDINNLTVGTYTLVVTDANGCEIQDDVTLTEPEEMDITFTTNQPSCFEGNDGSITTEVNAGGVAPFQFTWGANANNQVGATASNLEMGNYIVTVEDANGCIQTASTTLGEPSELVIDTVIIDELSCFGSNDGGLSAEASGGSGVITYEISLNGSIITSNIDGDFENNLAPGNYILRVVDENGCEASEDFTIIEPPQLELLVDDFNDPSCFGSTDGNITVIAQNGEAPYTFELADGTTPVTGGVFVLGNGIYDITVTDANGCTATTTQTLQNPPPVFVDIVADTTSIEMGEPLNLEAVTENTTGSVVYEWSTDIGLSCTDCQSPTAVLYSSQDVFVTVTDSLGCNDETSQFIEVLENLSYFVPNAFTPGNTDGTNDNFRVFGENIQYVEMLIFNRWGEKVFEAASPFVTWDGTFKGELQQPGVFTYYVKITFLNGRSIEDKGSVTLIR